MNKEELIKIIEALPITEVKSVEMSFETGNNTEMELHLC